ncbi:MAG: hypothetical protein AAF211_18465, partial [Myxococcota bacterium]
PIARARGEDAPTLDLLARGNGALKMFPFFDDGGETVFSVFQEFQVGQNGIDVGDSFTFTAYAFTGTGDTVAGNNQVYLTLKGLDANNGFATVLDERSALIDSTSTPDTWIELTTTATIPANATIFQAVYEFRDCAGQAAGSDCFDAGSVYFDDGNLIENTTP